MPTTTTTHLNFRDEARQALEFYRSISGGELTIVTYGDLGAAHDPSEAEQVMWGQVLVPGGFHVMAYDVQPTKPFERGQNSFYVALRSETAEETQALWDGLSDGATIHQPLGETPWSALYGMLTDRFGITWVLDVESDHQG
jgi:PhnB protein